MFTVHMNQALRPSPFMQIIDILRHDQQIARPFGVKVPQGPVRRIGLRLLDCRAPHVIETQHQIRIAGESLRRRDILNPMLFPKAPFGAKSINPTFGGNASASENHDIADILHLPH